MRKYLSTPSLAKRRYNAQAVLKIYELFICGYIHYITRSWCKIVLKQQHPNSGCKLNFLVSFSSYYQNIFNVHDVQKNTKANYSYNYTCIYSSFFLLNFMLPTPQKVEQACPKVHTLVILDWGIWVIRQFLGCLQDDTTAASINFYQYVQREQNLLSDCLLGIRL